MRALPRLLALTLGLALLASRPASAGMDFSFYFDDNGFTSPLNPIPPIVGTGSLDLASSVADGTYTLASLPAFTLSFSFLDGNTWTQANIISDPNMSEVVIYNNGQNAYFTDIAPSDPFNGALDLVNPSGAVLSFSPSFFGLGFFVEQTPTTLVAGNYGNAVVPEPSSLALVGLAGWIGIIPAAIRKRRKATASA